MSVALINSKTSEAVTLIEAGDYAGADAKLLVVETLMAVLPRVQRESSELEFKPDEVRALRAEVKQKAAAGRRKAGGGLKGYKARYTRPGLE